MAYRQKMHLKLKKGALHKQLHVGAGKKLTSKEIAIHKGDSALTKKRKIFAQNARKWHHGGGRKLTIEQRIHRATT